MTPLLTVNGTSLSLQEAVRRDILHDNEFLTQALEELLIRQYAHENGIENSDEELQVAADEMRYQRGLESEAETLQWFENAHQTLASVQNALDYQLLRNKVRNSIPEDEMRAYFADHKIEFDSVDLYSIRVDSRAVADELHTQIAEEGASFHDLAVEYSQDEETALAGGYAGRLTRSEMTGEIEASVFDAEVGEVIGPIETEHGWNLFMVRAVHDANYEDVEDRIRFQMFQDLLDQLKAEADITHDLLDGEGHPETAQADEVRA